MAISNRVLGRSKSILTKLGCIEFLEQRIAPATIQLLGSVTGNQNWNDTAVWIGGVVPTSVDDVVIDSSAGSIVLNITGVAAARSITMAADETLAISSTLNLAGGVAAPDTVFTNLNLGGGGALNLGADADYTVSGILNWNDSSSINGPGILNATSTSAIAVNSGAPGLATTLRVDGTLTHGNAYLDFISDNGSIEMQSGSIYNASNVGYSWREFAPGVPVGVSFEAGSTFRNSAGSAFNTGDITVVLNGATVDIVDGGINFSNNVTFTNATLNVAAGEALVFSSINAAVNGTLTKTGAGDLHFNGGTLTNNAAGVAYEVPNMYMYGNPTLAGGNIQWNGDLAIVGDDPNLATQMTITGTMIHTNAYFDFTTDNATLIIPAGSTYNANGVGYSWRDQALGVPVGVSFETGSTFRNSSASAFNTGDLAVTLTGATVDIMDGGINFTNNVTFTDVTLNVATGKALVFTSINAAVNGTLTKTGAGDLHFNGGTLTNNIAGVTYEVPNMYMNGNPTLAGGSIQWNGDLAIIGNDPNLATQLTIAGTMTHTNAYFDFTTDNAALIIPSGSVYNTNGGGYSWREFAPGVPVGVSFEAGSIFRHSSVDTFLTAGMPLSLTGATVDIVDGGISFSNNVTFTDVTLNVALGEALVFGSINAAVNGTLTKTGPGDLYLVGGTLTANALGATFDIPNMYMDGNSTLAGGNIQWNGNLTLINNDPNLATQLTIAGTLTHGSAYLDFLTDNAEIIIPSGSVYNTNGGGYSWRNQAPSLPVGVSFEAGSIFRHSSVDTFLTAGMPLSLTGATVDIVDGGISFSNNVTFTDVTLNVALGEALVFGSINAAVNGTLTKTGPGDLYLVGGTLTANALGATFDIPNMYMDGNSTLAGGNIQWNGNLTLINNEPNLATQLTIAGTLTHGSAYFDFLTDNAEIIILTGSVYNTNGGGYSWRDQAPGLPVGVSFEAGSTFRNSSVDTFNTAGIPVTLAGATVDIVNGGIHFTNNVTFTDATLNVATGKALVFTAINAAVNGTLTKTGGGNLHFNGGTLTNNAAGVTYVVPIMYMDGNPTLAGGNIQWNGDLAIVGNDPNLATQLTIAGTMTHSNAYFDFTTDNASLIIPSGSIYNTNGGGYSWRDQAPGLPVGVSFEAGSTFRNSSVDTFNTAGIPVTLAGATVDIVNGGIHFTNNVTFTDATLNAATGKALVFTAINAAVNGTLTKTGAGDLHFNGGTLTNNAAGVTYVVPNMYMNGNPTLAGGNIQWNGDLTIVGNDPNLATRLTIDGTLSHGNAYFDFITDNAELVVADGSSYLSNNGGYALRDQAPGDAVGLVIEEGGLFEVVAGSFNTGDVRLTNEGTIHASGGSLGVGNIAGGSLNGGVWKIDAGRSINNTGALITSNAATVEIAGSFGGFAPTTNTGTLRLMNGADITTGTTFVNSGVLELSPGSILTAGGFIQTGTGHTVFQIAGMAPASVGRVAASGAVTLGGIAELELVAPFVPAAGNVITLIQYSSVVGSFANVEGLYLGRQVAFEAVAGDTAFVVNSLIDAADLVTTAVTSPSSGIAGSLINVAYTVQNTSVFAITGDWTDSIYLSADGTVDAGDTLISRVTHTSGLAAGLSYNENVSVPLPGKIPGNYKVIVVAESRGVVPDANRANNTFVSSTDLALDVPTITEGVAFDGVINANQDLYFKVSMPSNKGRTFSLTTLGGGVAGMSVQIGDVPGRFGGNGFSANNSSYQEVLLPGGSANDFYIHIHGKAGIGAANFSLFADGLDFGLSSSSTARGSNADLSGATVTTTVKGTNFSPDTQFALVGAENFPAYSAVIRDTNTAFVTFSLQNRTLGTYSLVATDEALTSTLTNAFQIVNTSPGVLDYSVSAPSYIRAPYRGVEVTLTYSNLGDTDLLAPYFSLIPENAKLKLEGRSDFMNGAIGILGTSPEGPAGIIAPGKSYTIRIPYVPIDNSLGAKVDFKVQVLGDDTDAIDWDLVKDGYRPDTMSEEAWDAVWSNFTASVGDSTEGFHRVLIENANYLSQFGPVGHSILPLMAFEFAQADNFGEISGRYQHGEFGYGGEAPFGSKLDVDTAGNIVIENDGIVRAFRPGTAPGTFKAVVPEETGTLAPGPEAGSYILTEISGAKSKYNPDGRLEFIEDTNSNRVTGAYNAQGNIISLTDSLNGDVTSFTYNANGLITSLTDAVGRVTNYTYDANDNVLTVVAPLGTTTFTYSPTFEHAIATVAGPDGVVTSYTYNSAGRVSSITKGTGPDAITNTFAYDVIAGTTVTDEAGQSISFFRNGYGETARVVDPYGHATVTSFDSFGRPISITDPSGVQSKTSYQRANLVGSSTLGDGNKIDFSYNAKNKPVSIVTPGGGVSSYGYDGNGNLTLSATSDGSFTNFTYDAKGRVTTATDARGLTVTNAYNAAGLLASQDYSTGESIDYTYDAHRNMLTATDSEGTTTYTYNSLDLATSVTYPNGKTIAYTYDSANRRLSVSEGAFTVKYSYDALGRIASLKDATNAPIVNYDYDSRGLLASELRGNGSSTEYTHDLNGRVATITHLSPSDAVQEELTYSYDDVGRVESVVSNAGTTSYNYDLVGQLISVELPDGRTIDYTYDANGNRILVNDDGTTTSYSTVTGDRYSSVDGTNVTYDAAGRILNQGGETYTYNAAGRIATVISGGNNVTYDYDALGNRIGVITNGVRTDFAIDPAGLGNVFSETTGGISSFYAIGNGLEGKFTAGDASYYHHDMTGSTLLLTGNTGAVDNTYTYLPFGEIDAQTGTVQNRFTFNGSFGVQDETGDRYFMRNRDYDASLGRFLTRDPIGFSAGDSNLYRFVKNNPASMVDPSGLLEFTAGASAEFAAGLGVNGGIGYTLNVTNPGDSGIYTQGGVSLGSAQGAALTFGIGTSTEGIASAVGGSLGPIGLQLSWDDKGDFSGVQVALGPKGTGGLAPGGSAQVTSTTVTPFNTYNLGYGAYGAYEGLAEGAHNAGYAAGYGAMDALGRFHDYMMDGFVPDALLPGALGEKRASDALMDYYRDKARQDGLDGDAADDKGANDAGKSGGSSSRYFGPGPNGGAGSGGSFGGSGPGAGRGPGSSGSAGSGTVGPADPNQMIGPGGYDADEITGDIFTQPIRFGGFVADGGPFNYTILFENKPIAQAPAQVVTVTQTLDADLDLATFELIKFGWGDFEVFAPSGLTSWETRVDAIDALGVYVDINASLNPDTRLLTVIYTSIDPMTGDIPLDPFAGFLPPNITAPEGDGFLSYSVRPNEGLASDTDFTAVASIVFDFEAPLSTPTLTNTLDSDAPASAVTAFASATDSRGRFLVNWTTSDSVEGAGLRETVVYYTDNDGPLIEFYRGTDATSKVFTDGVQDHTYKFFSTATDNVSNAEEISATPDATITVDAEMLLIGTKRTFMDSDGDTYTITLSGPGTLNAVILDPDGDGNGPLDRLILTGSTDKSKVSILVKRAKDGPDLGTEPDGDGIVTLGDLIVTGDLASFTAKSTDLNVQGIIASGRLGKITVRDIASTNPLFENMVIQAGGTADSKLKFSLIARNIADGFEISTGTAIASITASSIGEGLISGAALASLTTKIGAMNADLDITGIVGKVSAKTSINSGNWEAASFGKVSTLGGNLDTDIESAGAIGSISVKGGSLTGGLNAFSYGKIAISGGGFSGFIGSDTLQTTLVKKPALAALSITGGDITGTVALAGNLGSVSAKAVKNGPGGSINGATITAAAISAITTGLDVIDSLILAGASLGNDFAPGGTGDDTDVYAGGLIGKVAIGRNAENSVIAAGLSSTNATYKDVDDSILSSLTSKIASLVIKGTADADNYFATGSFKAAPKIAGLAVTPASDARFLVVV